ncbi:MAG: PIN domain-containing protein [Gemmatimonadaceae bacterium]
MNVLVDTSVWSLALRRTVGTAAPETHELTELIHEGRVIMLGAVRQELLSGIKTVQQFEKLRDVLRSFPDAPLGHEIHEEAAECFNACRKVGVQGSNTDFLICAAAMHLNAAIFTTDNDFSEFARMLPLVLHAPRGTSGTSERLKVTAIPQTRRSN